MWRLKCSYHEISKNIIKTTIAFEDKYFYYHYGINPISLFKSLWLNFRNGQIISGASTITMQLAKLIEPKKRTYKNKIFELFRSLQLELKFSKDEILEHYFNIIPYGGNIVGLKAASLIYFNKYPSDLTIGESATLVSIPQRPSYMRPDKKKSKIKEGRDRILKILLNSSEINKEIYENSIKEYLPKKRYKMPFIAPHFCDIVKKSNSGKIIKTTIDKLIQKKVQKKINEYISSIKNFGINNGAALIVNRNNNSIIAYVGSNDWFDNKNGGQINGVNIARSSGSTLKPFLYGLAISKGIITPKKFVKNIPINFNGYNPKNYLQDFSGYTSISEALQKSLNIPAIELLNEFGYKNFYNFLNKTNIKSLSNNINRYGISLIIGGAELNLFDLVYLYTGLSNYGNFNDLNFYDNLVKSNVEQLIDSSAAFIISDILANNDKSENFSNITNNIPWKTGTSYGHRDAWAIGYNEEFVIGVWLGNFSNQSSPGMTGRNAAGPLLFSIFNLISNKDRNISIMPNNLGKRKVCSLSGQLPNKSCTNLADDFFIKGISNINKCKMHETIYSDLENKFTYCVNCKENNHIKKNIFLPPIDVANWLNKNDFNYEKLPHNPKCDYFNLGHAPIIKSPLPKVHYEIINEEDISNQKISFIASTDLDVDSIYWFNNDILLEKIQKNKPYFWLPEKGKNDVMCLDDKGRFSRLTFYIK